MAVDLTTVTASDFRARFRRDFPYLPLWLVTVTYNTGDVVFYDVTGLFYRALNDGVTSIPTTVLDWVQIEEDVDNFVSDQDIMDAFDEAIISFNQGLLGTDSQVILGFLYLTAHYLVHDIRTAQDGIASQGNFPVSSRSVGNVSETRSIPEKYLSSEIFSFYATTGYGIKYLNLVVPMLKGNVVTIAGDTLA